MSETAWTLAWIIPAEFNPAVKIRLATATTDPAIIATIERAAADAGVQLEREQPDE